MDKPLGGLRASPPGKFLGPVLCRKRNLVIRIFFFFFGCRVFSREREKKYYSCTFVFFLNNSEIPATPWT